MNVFLRLCRSIKKGCSFFGAASTTAHYRLGTQHPCGCIRQAPYLPEVLGLGRAAAWCSAAGSDSASASPGCSSASDLSLPKGCFAASAELSAADSVASPSCGISSEATGEADDEAAAAAAATLTGSAASDFSGLLNKGLGDIARLDVGFRLPMEKLTAGSRGLRRAHKASTQPFSFKRLVVSCQSKLTTRSAWEAEAGPALRACRTPSEKHSDSRSSSCNRSTHMAAAASSNIFTSGQTCLAHIAGVHMRLVPWDPALAAYLHLATDSAASRCGPNITHPPVPLTLNAYRLRRYLQWYTRNVSDDGKPCLSWFPYHAK